MKTKLSLAGMVLAALLGWSCGAQVVGEVLRDAGAMLADSGVAHAQTTCTWSVHRFSMVNSAGTGYATEVVLPLGWEPFAFDSASGIVVARRCQ